MVFIPYPPASPDAVPIGPNPIEMGILRQQTLWFIEQDPFEIVLIPREKVRLATGGYAMDDGDPRDAQRFKFIYGGNTGAGRAGIVPTGDGRERMFSFVLLGAYDCEWAIGDYFEDADGQHWEIEELLPENGYERKATARSYGGAPTRG